MKKLGRLSLMERVFAILAIDLNCSHIVLLFLDFKYSTSCVMLILSEMVG